MGKQRLVSTLKQQIQSFLLLLSCFNRVRLCVTPQTAAHQAPPSLGFSRQEHWSGLPFPSPVHESEKWKWSHSVVSNSQRSHDCSLPGSSIHGIFQARVLEWGAIAFSTKLPKYWLCKHTLYNCYWQSKMSKVSKICVHIYLSCRKYVWDQRQHW